MIDDAPSRSYTMDDLDFLMAAVTLTPQYDLQLAAAESRDHAQAARERDIIGDAGTPLIGDDELWPEELPRRLAEGLLAEVGDDLTLLALAESSRYHEVLTKVAKNPDTPLSAVIALAHTPHAITASLAARHPALETEDLSRLAFAPSPATRAGVAGRQNTPPTVAEMLLDDPDSWVRCCAAKHPHLSPQTLDRLVNGDDDRRLHVASHPGLTTDQLRQLAEDPQPVVRRFIARRPDLPDDLAILLERDPSEDVRRTVGARVTRPATS